MDLLPTFLHIEYFSVTEATVVCRLAASLRVEEGVGENRERGSVLFADSDDLGIELNEETVAVIGGAGHGPSRRLTTALGPRANPNRRGSPTPENTPVAGSYMTALTPPKNAESAAGMAGYSRRKRCSKP
jgi:hypothetical protein